MPVVTLFEHQSVPYPALGLTAQDPFCAAVDRLNAAAGREILQAGRTALRAGSWVGVVRVGAWLVEILPRLDYPTGEDAGPPPATLPSQPNAPGRRPVGANSPAAAAAARNLLALLAVAGDLPLHALAPAGLRERPGGWTGLLTALFAASLRQALVDGLLQAYVPREDVLPVLRGRWDLARQARQPLPAAHTLAVNYAEFTADTAINQVLRLAIEELLPVTADANTAGLLSDLRARLADVALRPELRSPALLAQLPEPVFDRHSAALRLPYQLAGLFLAGQALVLRAGPLPAYAFVFDMNRLFERFTAGFLARYRAETWPEAWRAASLLAQRALWGGPGLPGDRQGAAYLARQAGRPVLRIQPDLVFIQPGAAQPLLVGDNKYKDIGASHAPAEDVYQLLAYLLRLGCPRGLLLYPQLPGSPPARRVLSIDPPGAAPVQILAATINLRVPLEEARGVMYELRQILALAAGFGRNE